MSGLTQFKMLINGADVNASDGGKRKSIDPSTGEPWAEFPEATKEDVDLAVRAAHLAQTSGPWSKLTPTERGQALYRLADALSENADNIGRLETRDTGKLLKETVWQAKYISDYLRYFGGAADKISGDTLPIDKQDMFVYTSREPLGVIAAVIPWNSQLFLSATKIGPALAMGNTLVLKASEHAPAPLLAFAKLAKKAGIPDGVINVITGGGEPCGRELTSHNLVSKIAFTGGGSAARHVVRNSAENFAQVSLELGGKSPFIVFDDANISSATNACVAGIFGASGQSCVAGSRLLVQEDIADLFVEKLSRIAENIRLGDPADGSTEMGPLCTIEQIKLIDDQINKAVSDGAKVVCGGGRTEGKGLFFKPTIVDCPDSKINILDTELFGPVLSVVRFKTEAEAIMLANDTKYGLAAGVFTNNHSRALRMSKNLRAGIVWVNTYRAISPIAEFGGERMSGYGREAGFQALYDYSQTKSVWMNLSDEPVANPFRPR
ncbi:MAG: aldehyde dehydrogenase [Alphaproteobacteria bacterium]